MGQQEMVEFYATMGLPSGHHFGTLCQDMACGTPHRKYGILGKNSA